MLWASAGEPFNDAVIELWIASRTDPELRSAVVETERRLQEQFWDLLRTLMGAEAASHPNFNLRIEFALAQFRGIAILDSIAPARVERPRELAYARQRLIDIITLPYSEDLGTQTAATSAPLNGKSPQPGGKAGKRSGIARGKPG